MQHDRIFGTDHFWVCLVARHGAGNGDRWVCDVSLYPRASTLGTFNGLAVKEAQVSGLFTAPNAALDEGELLGMRLADVHSCQAAGQPLPKCAGEPENGIEAGRRQRAEHN